MYNVSSIVKQGENALMKLNQPNYQGSRNKLHVASLTKNDQQMIPTQLQIQYYTVGLHTIYKVH